MEWWAGGGRARRWKDNRFFLCHRTEQMPSGGRRRNCDAVWSDPRHYELCKPGFVHKMGVKRSCRRAQSSFYFLLPVCIYISTQYIWTNVTVKWISAKRGRLLPRRPVSLCNTSHSRPLRSPQFGILSNQSQSLVKEKKGLCCYLFFLFFFFFLYEVCQVTVFCLVVVSFGLIKTFERKSSG